MAQSKLYPVVMAGGSGSRLWPLSRVLYPKQFLCLKGDLTMLQTTICPNMFSVRQLIRRHL